MNERGAAISGVQQAAPISDWQTKKHRDLSAWHMCYCGSCQYRGVSPSTAAEQPVPHWHQKVVTEVTR
jgi:hypothetical protein